MLNVLNSVSLTQVPKVYLPTNEVLYFIYVYKTLHTSVLYSPMSSLFLNLSSLSYQFYKSLYFFKYLRYSPSMIWSPDTNKQWFRRIKFLSFAIYFFYYLNSSFSNLSSLCNCTHFIHKDKIYYKKRTSTYNIIV